MAILLIRSIFHLFAAKFPFRGPGIYKITGKVIEEFDCANIEVVSMHKLAVIEDPRYSDVIKAIEV